MPSEEESNVATLEIWLNEVHANRRVELGPGLLAPSYIRRGPSGPQTLTPESFAELAEPGILARPRFQCEWIEIVARGDRVAGLWRTEELNDERRPSSQLGIYRFEDGKLAELWHPRLPDDAEPWPGAPRPREQWAIASAESLTADEEANLATFRHWVDLNYNRRDDLEAVPELLTDPFVSHSAAGTRSGRPEGQVQSLVGFRERAPGYDGQSDEVFIVGDLAARRFRYRYPEPLPDRGSFQVGATLYRFEDHRIAEYWAIYMPNDMDWD
jgi:predicted SnoaL-like aldol condensation-catalyzing enzyme